MEFFTIAAGISVHVWDTGNTGTLPQVPPLRPAVPQTSPAPSPLAPDAAQRPCLVLLHGYLETMYVFNELVDALKDRCRLIVIDLPGHGLTDSAPAGQDGGRVNSIAFCAQVVAGVMDRCGVEKAVIAGHSMGGYVTLKFLEDFPGRAEKAILLSSHPFPDAPEKAADRKREKDLIAAGKLSALAAISIPKMYHEDNLRACDEKIRETVELCETHDPEGIIFSIEGLRTRTDTQAVMQHPPVPLMLVHGDHDNFQPLEMVERMKVLFPDVRYRLVPGSGHNAFIERQDEVVAAISEFTTGNC
ncbi:MAG: alpha/beta hydrolase [Bacteroidales bacterium]|nr:alpha/beta hydrolase [Bacteroidales bacterium]